MKYLIKIDRLFAWILFISIFLYFVSGYGMTKGVITPKLAADLHLSILTYIVLVSFVVHTGFAIHLAFKRWNFWNVFGKLVWAVFYIAFILFFVYVDRYYQKPKPSVAESDDIVLQGSVQSSPTTSTQPLTRTFTLAELAKYNGQGGNPPYVSVDGIVYDMTSVFTTGSHYSHFAGQELTSAFYSRHSSESITKYSVVGTLIK